MAEGQSSSAEPSGLRPAAPYQGGPLGSSGAAPEKPVPPPAGPPDAPRDTDALREPAAPSDTAAPRDTDTDRDSAAPGDTDAARDSAAPGDTDAARDSAGPGDTDASGAGVSGEAGAGSGSRPARWLSLLRGMRRLLRGLRRAGRRAAAWARRPAGRLILPAIIAVLLLGATVTAGAYLVPHALQAMPVPSSTPEFATEGAPTPAPTVSFPDGLPPLLPSASGVSSVAPTRAPATAGQRPADAMAGWAQQVGTRVGIPVVAVEAYGYAELVLARTTPGCHLSWTTLAAIGKVESNHGSSNHSVLEADGTVRPPIYGLPLDGNGARQLIRDTDHGAIDGDPTYDRAIGPMQFIPSTWLANQVDADNSGVADPNDIDDAALTAGVYLCKGGRDMSKADFWWQAILSYNAVQPYVQQVFAAANDYGLRSRT